MSSEYLKAVAAGGAFDPVEAIREIAKTLTDGPITVKASVTAGGGINGLSLRPGGGGEAVSEPVEGEAEYIPTLLDGESMAPPKTRVKKKM